MLKSESLVACSFKATKVAPQQNLIIKPSLSEDNSDLLEACSSKVRIDTVQNRSVTAPPAPKLFNYSSFTDPNTKITLLRGSPCHSVDFVLKKKNTELFSPYSGSRKESAGLKYTYEGQTNAEVEGVDLNYLKLMMLILVKLLGPPLLNYQKFQRSCCPL